MEDLLDQVLLRVRPSLLPEGDRESSLRLLSAEVSAAIDHPALAGHVLSDAWEREQVESTYIGMGLAVPHARVEQLPQAALYLAFSQAGIPWPHEEAHLIALLVVPWESPEMHLQLLSRLIRWRRNLTEAEICSLAESPDKMQLSLNTAFADIS